MSRLHADGMQTLAFSRLWVPRNGNPSFLLLVLYRYVFVAASLYSRVVCLERFWGEGREKKPRDYLSETATHMAPFPPRGHASSYGAY